MRYVIPAQAGAQDIWRTGADRCMDSHLREMTAHAALDAFVFLRNFHGALPTS
jgi:hypothetical protein